MIRLLLLAMIVVLIPRCSKENEKFVGATVINKGGCYSDSWLLAIENPSFSRHSFLRPATLSACATCYNCSNAVYVRLPASLAIAGTKVRFKYNSTELSCFSSMEPPEHILVKELSRR